LLGVGAWTVLLPELQQRAGADGARRRVEQAVCSTRRHNWRCVAPNRGRHPRFQCCRIRCVRFSRRAALLSRGLRWRGDSRLRNRITRQWPARQGLQNPPHGHEWRRRDRSGGSPNHGRRFQAVVGDHFFRRRSIPLSGVCRTGRVRRVRHVLRRNSAAVSRRVDSRTRSNFAARRPVRCTVRRTTRRLRRADFRNAAGRDRRTR